MNLDFIYPEWTTSLRDYFAKSYTLCKENADAVVGMSITLMESIERSLARSPGAKLFLYHWDEYSWTKTRPRPNEYDFQRWHKLIEKAECVWCPSLSTVAQIDRDAKCKSVMAVRSFVPNLEKRSGEISDGRFVFQPLRHLPDDAVDWCSRACSELGIRCVHPEAHSLTDAEYDEALRTCTMAVSSYREASTGGLGIIEAAWYGKPVVVNSSPGNGAVDYLLSHANYFNDTYEGLRDTIRRVWDGKWTPPPSREYLRDAFCAERMAREMEYSLCGRWNS